MVLGGIHCNKVLCITASYSATPYKTLPYNAITKTQNCTVNDFINVSIINKHWNWDTNIYRLYVHALSAGNPFMSKGTNIKMPEKYIHRRGENKTQYKDYKSI